MDGMRYKNKISNSSISPNSKIKKGEKSKENEPE